MYPAIRKCLVSYLKNVLPDAIALAEHCRRMTVTVNDILLALKRRGQCVSFQARRTSDRDDACRTSAICSTAVDGIQLTGN